MNSYKYIAIHLKLSIYSYRESAIHIQPARGKRYVQQQEPALREKAIYAS